MSPALPSDAIQPNLFLVGAEKSGTTSLYVGLKSHPDIFMSDPKELGFFIPPRFRPEAIFGTCTTEQEALRIYVDVFRAAGSCRYVGEASTWYTMRPINGQSAEAIHAFAPAARIIYIIRDPMERTISDYWYHFRLEIEKRRPFQAITEDSHYCDVSNYAMQIRPYLERFSREHVWVLTLEEFSQDPGAELARIFQWLDLDPGKACLPTEVRENVAPPQFVRYPEWLVEFLQSRHYQSVRSLIPIPARTLFRKLSERRITTADVDLTDVKAFLRPRQQRETEELADLLGRDFRHWKTLYEQSCSRTKCA